MRAKKSIFITGAASGIGEATAQLFTKEGWLVGLFDIQEDKLSHLASGLGESAFSFPGDILKDYELTNALEKFSLENKGKIDVLFNSAGVLYAGNFEENSIEVYKRIVDINLTGTINAIYSCLPYLRNSENGKIINMSSASAIYGTPQFAVYSASKFAVKGLTEALNIEFEKYGIHVCDLMPSFVNTPMLQNVNNTPDSIQKLGIKLGSGDIAKLVWRSAHEKKIHRIAPFSVKLLSVVSRVFPFMQKLVIKMISQ